MKRLLGLTGITCFSVLTACFYFCRDYALLIAVAAAALFIISMLFATLRSTASIPLVFLTIALSAFMFFTFSANCVYPVQRAYSGKTAVVTATQRDEVIFSNGCYCYEMDIDTIDGKDVKSGLLVRADEPFFSLPYDKVTFEAELEAVESGISLSKKLYLQADIFDMPEFSVERTENKPFMYRIIELRQSLRRAVYLEMDKDTADFASALTLGDKYALSKETKELLRVSGLSHIAVVSGLHISIVTSLCLYLFRIIFRNKYVYSFLTIGCVVGFALLTGLGVSVVRASVMLIFCIVAKLINRINDSVNSLGAAALVILLVNPYAVGDVGMLLSFTATLGIVLWSQRLSSYAVKKLSRVSVYSKRPVKALVNPIIVTLSVTFSATVWTLPINILFFKGFSSASLIANLSVVPLLGVALVSSALCVMFHFVSFLPFAADFFAFVTGVFFDYLIWICSLLRKLEYSYIRADSLYFVLWISATLILAAVAVLIGKSRGYKLAAMFSLLIILLSSVSHNAVRENVITLTVPDTGSGLSVILESSEGHAVLTIGGSNSKTNVFVDELEKLLSSDSDILIDTGRKNSDIYLKNILSQFDYKTVLRYDNTNDISREIEDGNVIFFEGDYEVSLWDKATLTVLTSDNEVYEYIRAGNTDILILPDNGDCGHLDEKYLSPDVLITRDAPKNSSLLSCDILIIPGDDFTAKALREYLAPVANRVATDADIKYDIDLSE
ncbi:MAG: ComEC/Rec2 family competence protein [Ruminococcus sp.]